MTTALKDPRWRALSKKRREELLEKHRDVNVDYEWWDGLFRMFVEDLREAGILVSNRRTDARHHAPAIYFTGFWSQGDGACFDGEVDDWEKALAAVGMPQHTAAANELGFSFSSRTVTRNCMSFEADMPFPENPYDEDEEPLQHAAFDLTQPGWNEIDVLIKKLEDWFQGFADKLYRDLEEEHDYLTDDEQVADWVLQHLEKDELIGEDEEEFSGS